MTSDCRTVLASENQTIIQEANKIDKIFHLSILFEIPLNKTGYYAFHVTGWVFRSRRDVEV